MIKKKLELKRVLKYEKERYGNISRFWWFLAVLNISENAIIWRYQRTLRIWEYHHNSKHKIRALISKIKTNKIGRKYGIHIGPNSIDDGLIIKHLGPILINSNARIGKNCTIHINTAFVATGGNSNSPHIGNNCKIGVGATLVGNITLGNNVVVGAGAVVTKSFDEDHITLAGVPAKIISRKANL